MQPAIQTVTLVSGQDEQISGVFMEKPEHSGSGIGISDRGFADADTERCDIRACGVWRQQAPPRQCVANRRKPGPVRLPICRPFNVQDGKRTLSGTGQTQSVRKGYCAACFKISGMQHMPNGQSVSL